MMITGDYQHTAIAVARGVGMIAMDSQVVIMEAKSERVASASAPVARHTPPFPKPGSALQHPGGKTSSSSCQHLMFTSDRGGVCEEMDPHTAITSIAQVGCAKNTMLCRPYTFPPTPTTAKLCPHLTHPCCKTIFAYGSRNLVPNDFDFRHLAYRQHAYG